ncbi:MAG: hypothetical protein PUP46_00585 [Endozoicomonas sp. (ex Botrylloides leachii)]|nr:hypothetical protein [Endozoicomonas sp. (ex Botrylloides leachii)]
MNEITVATSITGSQWSQSDSNSSPDAHIAAENTQVIEALYKRHREAEQRLIYNQLAAAKTSPSLKDRSARMAAIVAQQRIII